MRSRGTYINSSPATFYSKNSGQPYTHSTRFIDEHGHLIKAPVLDVGCGTGEITAYIAGKMLVPVIGVDISQERISLAKSTYRTVGFTVADVVTLSATPALAVAGMQR